MDRLVLSSLSLAAMALAGSVALAVDARPASPAIIKVRVDPDRLRLAGPGCRFSLLVSGETTRGEVLDLTREAAYLSRNPSLAEIGPDGVVRSVADGQTQIEVTAAGKRLTIPVQVSGSHQPRSLHFENDILPILSRFGCNSSGCHGKAEGQNGFKLSIFGFDPRADRVALVEEGRGRRIFPAAPEESLMLKKATGRVPHGGGVRIHAVPPSIACFMNGSLPDAGRRPGRTTRRVDPTDAAGAAIAAPRLSAATRRRCAYTDGREVDVTSHAKFQSNREELAGVDSSGLVTAGDHPGEAAIMAAYMNQVDVFRGSFRWPRRARSVPGNRIPRRHRTSSIDWSRRSSIGSTSSLRLSAPTTSSCVAFIST